MTIKKTTAILSVSALAIAISSASQAVELQAGDTTLNLYGYAKLDMIYDVDAKLSNAVGRQNIRLDGVDGSDGHFDAHAFQSRLGFITSTPVGGSTLRTMLEGDFYGPNNNFRLRHAYGEWDGLLAGQTSTNFGGFLGMTPTVDFNGQPGQANVGRQAQLRYTVDGFSVALEDSGSLGGNLGGQLPDSDDELKNSLPDLTLRYQGGVGDVNYAASALLRRIEYYSALNDSDEGTTGWGINLEASTAVTDGVMLRGSITHGDGVGGYQYISPGPAGYVDSNGNVQSITGTGGTAGISVAAGPGNVNFAYGIATVDLDDAVADGALSAASNDTYEGYFLNYIWSPVRNVTYGVEVGYHTREVQDGRDGDAVRLQGMVQYNF
ncbi:MAG: hypothetical protein IKE45_07215 [Halomonas sp.]|nr:DcaP family trimeric outer membrane transporter [Halomonas sp.]MBR2513799.1 hypothetical protein [Halomonas sp.]